MKNFSGSEDIGFSKFYYLNSCDSPFKVVRFFLRARPTALLFLVITKFKFAETGNLPIGWECIRESYNLK
jgi:hypothetical protein